MIEQTNTYDIIKPYDKQLIHLTREEKYKYFIKPFIPNRKPECLFTNTGGITLFKKNVLEECGGYMEFNGYGGEDRALDVQIINKKYKIFSNEFNLIHLFHNKSFDINNKEEITKYVHKYFGCTPYKKGKLYLHGKCKHVFNEYVWFYNKYYSGDLLLFEKNINRMDILHNYPIFKILLIVYNNELIKYSNKINNKFKNYKVELDFFIIDGDNLNKITDYSKNYDFVFINEKYENFNYINKTYKKIFSLNEMLNLREFNNKANETLRKKIFIIGNGTSTKKMVEYGFEKCIKLLKKNNFIIICMNKILKYFEKENIKTLPDYYVAGDVMVNIQIKELINKFTGRFKKSYIGGIKYDCSDEITHELKRLRDMLSKKNVEIIEHSSTGMFSLELALKIKADEIYTIGIDENYNFCDKFQSTSLSIKDISNVNDNYFFDYYVDESEKFSRVLSNRKGGLNKIIHKICKKTPFFNLSDTSMLETKFGYLSFEYFINSFNIQ